MKFALAIRAMSVIGIASIWAAMPIAAYADISTGSVNDISTGSGQDIRTGGVTDISTGSILDISTGSVSDISTGSGQDISTGGVTDISTGSILDISTGSGQDISTGGVTDISTGSVNDIGTGSELIANVSSGTVLTGPIEQIDYGSSEFVSLGQNVMVSKIILSSIKIGDFVTVEGSVAGPGWLYADRISVSKERYVPGAMEVFVAGIPSEIDTSTGQTTIGKLTVDFTASMAGDSVPTRGAVWTFRGVQPNDKGVMLSGKTTTMQ